MMRADEQPPDGTEAFHGALAADSRQRAVSALLRVPRLRKLWTAQLLGGIGDRLALLVLVLLCVEAAWSEGSFGGGYRGVSFVVAAVFGARFLATLLFGVILLGPVAALTAPGGGLDRRWTMIASAGVRVALLAIAPLWLGWTGSSSVVWLLVTVFLAGAAERVWAVAMDATTPALLPAPAFGAAPPASTAEPAAPAASAALRLLGLRTSYGTVPLGAAALVAVTLVSNLLAVGVDFFHTHQAALASFAAAALFAAAIARLYLLELPSPTAERPRSPLTGLLRPKKTTETPSQKRGRTGSIRMLLTATATGCAAVAAATALAVLHAGDLGGGPVEFGLLALALTAGPVAGIRLAPRTLPGLSRRRLFALAIATAGLALLLAGLVPDPATVLLLALVAGTAIGVAANCGHILLAQEVEEDQAESLTDHLHAVVAVFAAVGAVAAPLLAAAFGPHRLDEGSFTFDHGGAAYTLMLVGALLFPVAALLLGRTDDRQGVPLRRDLRDALRGGARSPQLPASTGYFIAVEGGDGAGKSTQVEALATWIRGKGHEVVVTHEPGATAVGKRLRSILLDVSNTGVSHRAEALLYAADRAEHVAAVIRPALDRGAIVISDRFVDSSVAYQGAGRDLSPVEVARISRWATGGLVPHLTVLLDIAPETARERFTQAPDRLESEPAEFHQRVRQGFLALAAADPSRYLIVDAAAEPEAVTTAIRHRLDRELPLSEQEISARAEAERKAAEEARRRAEEEARQKAEEERRERERQEQLAKLRAEEEERRRAAEEEARRVAEEQQAELARKQAEEARRQAEEEAHRRAVEEAARLQAEELARRHVAEQARLREEAEQRRLERQRRAEEALLRAEEERRQAAEAAAQATAGDEETTITVEPPEVPPPSGSNDVTQTIQTPAPDPEADVAPTIETPMVDPRRSPRPAGATDETRPLPQAAPPAQQPSSDDPADRVPPWLWRADTQPQPADSPVERTRELPQITDPDPEPQPEPKPQAQPQDQAQPRRRRPAWAEETPLDDLPTLADELLGPRSDQGNGDDNEPST